MNPVEITNVVPPTEDVESTTLEKFNASRRPSPGAMGDARLRYALLAVIALLLTWLTLTVHHSVEEMDAQVQMIHANILSRSR